MDDERAETCLRLLVEAELRRARPGARDSAGRIAESVRQVRWAGEVLEAAGVLTDDFVARVVTELEVGLMARSEGDPQRLAHRLSWISDPPASQPPGPQPRDLRSAQPLRVTPVERTITIANARAPADLHLMTMVGEPTGITITAAMRMHWPPDGSSADLEITGAGPHHLPYDQLWAVDDQGTRYRLDMAGDGGTATWQGSLRLFPAPPPGTRWLDLIADGTHTLTRLDVEEPTARAPLLAGRITIGPSPAPAGERLLAVQAERILASAWDISGPSADRRLGEMITVLAEAGAIAADSQAPGHLASLCRRLGVAGHGITTPPTAEIPGRWASVLAQRDAEPAAGDREWFAPLGTVIDIEGTRLALAGLSSAVGQSHLHIVASGMPELPIYGWGLSWWVRDGAGNWHVTVESEPDLRAGGEGAFRLRLTPPLADRPEEIEVVVTGSVTRVRAVVPVRYGTRMPET